MKLLKVFTLFFFILSCSSDLKLMDEGSHHSKLTADLGGWFCQGRVIRFSKDYDISLSESESSSVLSIEDAGCKVDYEITKSSQGYKSLLGCTKTCSINVSVEPDYLLAIAYKGIKEKQTLTLDCSETSAVDFVKIETLDSKTRLHFRIPVQSSVNHREELGCYVEI